MERRRKAKAEIASSSSLSPSSLADANNKIKGGGRNIPRSWAQNLSRSYTDLQQEYQLRKEYFKQRYEADYDDSLDWEEEDDNDDDDAKEGEASSVSTRMGRMEHLAVGTSSYYRHEQDIANNTDEHYDSENDPKFVLFRHLLREWCVVSGNGSGTGSGSGNGNNDDNDDVKTATNPWPKKWSPNEEGYYEQGKIKQVALMKFPSQIQSTVDGNGLSVRDMIRREFRAPSVDERLRLELRLEEEQISKSNTDLNGVLSSSNQSTSRSSNTTTFPPSSYIDNEIRIQTAFYTLMELNRKLAWAEAIGFPPFTSSPQKKQTSSIQQSMRDEMKWKRLVQAAKGVSLFPTIPTAANGINQIAIANDDSDGVVYDNSSTPSASSPSILQCGTYLVAHPLMTGYFAKSVIVILDHTVEEDEKEVNTKPTTSEEGDVEGEESSSGGGGSGGTYGLIINRLALTPETMESSNQRQYLEMMLRLRRQEVVEAEGGLKADTPLSPQCTKATTTTTAATTHPNILRSISLLQAINADDLPETVQSAFGDAPVREGGPVNLSLQMIHRKSFCEVSMKDETYNTEDINEEKDFGPASNNGIGGTILGYDHDRSKNDAQDAIYFGGDVIKASYSVLGGESDRDDFSFVIGAACWAPGQLQHEIERGCWLPFRGPASMALTGMCEHNEISIPTASSKTTNTDSEKASDGKGTTKLSLFPPRPSHPPTGALQEQTTGGQSMTRRPVGDLWLSVMCALGEGEAEVANMMLDPNNVMHALGDACDNFDR